MPNKRRASFSLVAEQESVHSFLISENQYLKKQNQDLAKALTDTKIERQKLIQSNLELYDRLYSTDVQTIKFKEFIKAFSVDMGTYVQNFFSLTEQMANMRDKINMVLQPPEALTQLSSNPNSTNTSTDSTHSNKSMAKSMVSDHTILSPKINSAGITVNRLVEMVNNNTSNDTDDGIGTDDVEFSDNVSVNNEDLSGNSLEIDEMQNQRLETVHEEDEDEQSNLNVSQPLLSGLFKDITVYISPMNSQPVIKHKSKSPHKLRDKNFIHSNNSLSSNSPENTTLIQWSDQFSRNSTINDSNNGTKLKDTTDYMSGDIDHETETNNDDDPIEETSSLSTTFNSIPDETSTPYSPNTAVIEHSSVIGEPKTPRRPSSNVCRRKRITRKTQTTSPNLTRCSVTLHRIPSSTLKAYVLSNSYASHEESSKITYTERSDSPTVLEKSTRSSGLFTNSGHKKNSLESSTSPKIRRTRRNLKPVVYAEPSLAKKLRR